MEQAQAATSVESTAQDGEDLAAELVCPITHELMQDPVLTADGHAYERAAILRWLAVGSPQTQRSSCLQRQLVDNPMIPPLGPLFSFSL